jgi:hypothetical protein
MARQSDMLGNRSHDSLFSRETKDPTPIDLKVAPFNPEALKRSVDLTAIDRLRELIERGKFLKTLRGGEPPGEFLFWVSSPSNKFSKLGERACMYGDAASWVIVEAHKITVLWGKLEGAKLFARALHEFISQETAEISTAHLKYANENPPLLNKKKLS